MWPCRAIKSVEGALQGSWPISQQAWLASSLAMAPLVSRALQTRVSCVCGPAGLSRQVCLVCVRGQGFEGALHGLPTKCLLQVALQGSPKDPTQAHSAAASLNSCEGPMGWLWVWGFGFVVFGCWFHRFVGLVWGFGFEVRVGPACRVLMMASDSCSTLSVQRSTAHSMALANQALLNWLLALLCHTVSRCCCFEFVIAGLSWCSSC